MKAASQNRVKGLPAPAADNPMLNAVKDFEPFNPWPTGQIVCSVLLPGRSATG
jgi:hypothetical protein